MPQSKYVRGRRPKTYMKMPRLASHTNLLLLFLDFVSLIVPSPSPTAPSPSLTFFLAHLFAHICLFAHAYLLAHAYSLSPHECF